MPAFTQDLFENTCRFLEKTGRSKEASQVSGLAKSHGFSVTSTPPGKVPPKRGLPQFFLGRLESRASATGVCLPADLTDVASEVLERLSINQLQTLSKQLGARLPAGSPRHVFVTEIAAHRPQSMAVAALARANALSAANSDDPDES